MKKLINWIGRNPFTTGGLLLALGAHFANYEELTLVATACVFLGRAIVIGAEQIGKGEEGNKDQG